MTSDTNTLFGLQWPAPAAREIRINVIMMHGDAFDTFSESRLTFPDSPEGHETAQFAMKALPCISTVAADNRFSRVMSGYEICVAAAEEMSVPAATLAPLFESMFCQDARYLVYLALPVAYTLEHHTDTGIRRAAFPYGIGKHRHFKVITKSRYIDPKYLRHWA
jgi:hypothetical protein